MGLATFKSGVVALPGRFCTAIFAFVTVAAFLSTQLRLNPLTYLREGFRSASETDLEPENFRHAVSVSYEIPTAISSVIPGSQGPQHLFTVPRLVTYYQDLLPNNHTKLYFVTGGIMMRVSRRNLRAVACMVGDDVYPASIFVVETLHCEVPRLLRPGERLVPVLAWDDQLKRAAKGPMTLRTGVVAELHPGDINMLPKSAVLRGNLTSANPKDFRITRSDLTVGPSDNFVAKKANLLPRYRLCLMTMVAPNSHMLKDWVDYHRRIGVDQVYIFDNGAARDLRKMFKGRKDVEIVDWPHHKTQIQAVTAFMFAARSRCERVQLEDSDEYPMFGLGNGTAWRQGDPPLIRFVKKAEEHGFGNSKLLHLVMANSGFLRRPEGEVPMNFIHRRKRQTFQNGKSICKMDLEWQVGAIHTCGLVNGETVKVFVNDIHQWGDLKMEPEEPDDPPYLVHYKDRSWEEYIEKWDAGRVSGKLVADKIAGTMSMDEPDESYMKVNPEMEYRHFRDKIYKRVLSEGSLDEQTVVQTTNGQRCERFYRLGNTERVLMREVCV